MEQKLSNFHKTARHSYSLSTGLERTRPQSTVAARRPQGRPSRQPDASPPPERLEQKFIAYKTNSNASVMQRAAALKALAFSQQLEIVEPEGVILKAADFLSKQQPQRLFPSDQENLNSAQSRFAYQVGERRKIRQLTDWLKLQLAKVEASNLPLTQIVEYKQQLFAGYFNVLVADISKTCQQRGECLKLVWRLLARLMNRLLTSAVGQLRTQQKQNLAEQKDLHCIYQRILDELTQQNSEYKRQLHEKQLFADNLIYNLRFKRREIRKLYNSIRIITDKVNGFREDYVDLQNEHIQLQMFIKDIGRETAEMLVERRRVINQQKNRRIKMNQSKKRNRKDILVKLKAEDAKEVKRLCGNLESNYHALRPDRGPKFLMDCELDEFAARLPEEVLEQAPFVVDSGTYGFVDQAVSAMEIEAPKTRNYYTETNFIERHKVDQIKSRGVQVVDSELMSLTCLNVGIQTITRKIIAQQVVDIAILPILRFEEAAKEFQPIRKNTSKKSKDRSKQTIDDRKIAKAFKPKTPQIRMLKKVPSNFNQNDRTFDRKGRGMRRMSNKKPTEEEELIEQFENLEEIRRKQEPTARPDSRAESKNDSKVGSPENSQKKASMNSFANFKKRNSVKYPLMKVVVGAPRDSLKKEPRRNAVVLKEEVITETRAMHNKIVEQAKEEEVFSDESLSLMEIGDRIYENALPRKSEDPINFVSAGSSTAMEPKATSSHSYDMKKRSMDVQSRKLMSRASEPPHKFESFRSRLIRKSSIPPNFLADGKADEVEITVEHCLMVVRQMNQQNLQSEQPPAPPKEEQVVLVKSTLLEAQKLKSVNHIEKVLYQSLVRAISEVYQLAEGRLLAGQRLLTVGEATMEVLMIGYGNIRNCNLHGKLVHLLSYAYRFRERFAVFELFALLNGLLTHLPYNSLICTTDFDHCMRLINALNCSPQGNIANAQQLFTTRQRIQSSCQPALRTFLGRSHSEDILTKLLRLIVQVKDNDRICLNRTVYFILTQVFETRLAYYQQYQQFLGFLNGKVSDKPVITLDNFEFLLRCMELRKTTLVEAAKRFGDRSDFQQLGSKCMTLQTFCAFAMQHDLPTFQQLRRKALEALEPRWELLCDSSEFFKKQSTAMLQAELRTIQAQLKACHKYGGTQRQLLRTMSTKFQQCQPDPTELVSTCYQLMVFEVLDGQSHRMLMLVVGGLLEDLYSLSIKLSIQE